MICAAGAYGHGMRTARKIWISEALVSSALLALVYSRLSGAEARGFFLAELALFGVSFLLALLLGGPSKVFVLGIGLGFALATLLAIGASNSCSDSDIVCHGPGAMFTIGLVVAGALYPGWALGTGLGTLARLETRPST